MMKFHNLFELVEYFRREPLRVVGYSVLLRDPVPQPNLHEGTKWFHKVSFSDCPFAHELLFFIDLLFLYIYLYIYLIAVRNTSH